MVENQGNADMNQSKKFNARVQNSPDIKILNSLFGPVPCPGPGQGHKYDDGHGSQRSQSRLIWDLSSPPAPMLVDCPEIPHRQIAGPPNLEMGWTS